MKTLLELVSELEALSENAKLEFSLLKFPVDAGPVVSLFKESITAIPQLCAAVREMSEALKGLCSCKGGRQFLDYACNDCSYSYMCGPCKLLAKYGIK